LLIPFSPEIKFKKSPMQPERDATELQIDVQLFSFPAIITAAKCLAKLHHRVTSQLNWFRIIIIVWNPNPNTVVSVRRQVTDSKRRVFGHHGRLTVRTRLNGAVLGRRRLQRV
jgi:hypothetical protein